MTESSDEFCKMGWEQTFSYWIWIDMVKLLSEEQTLAIYLAQYEITPYVENPALNQQFTEETERWSHKD